MLPTPVFLGFPGGSAGKESACNVGDLGSIPGLRDLLWRRAPAGGGLVAKLCPSLATPWTVARQAPPSMGLSRQEYWSGWPFPSPGHLPNPGIEPRSPALQADSLPTELWGKPLFWPGEFHGLYSPWGWKESGTTERLSLSLHFHFTSQVLFSSIPSPCCHLILLDKLRPALLPFPHFLMLSLYPDPHPPPPHRP